MAEAPSPLLIDLAELIESPRLFMRPIRTGDGAQLNSAVLETFEELHGWIPWARERPTVDVSELDARRAQAKFILREDLLFPIFDRSSNLLAGSIGFHRMRWEIPSFEIGYWIRKQFMGKGYATEAAHAMSRYAFEQLGAKRLEIRCDPLNERSCAVPQKLGYELEGRLRQNYPAGEGTVPSDTLVFARLDAAGLSGLSVRWVNG